MSANRLQLLLATQGAAQALYPIWSCRELKTGFKPNEYESSDPTEVIAGEIVSNLLKLGKFIGSKPKVGPSPISSRDPKL